MSGLGHELAAITQIRHGRLLLTRVKPTEIIESRLLPPHFYEVVRKFHFMTDKILIL